MQVDFLLLGQGISGTWLSYYLIKAGYSVLVIDEAMETSASKMAAGIINPVTGRRIVKTWMIDELLPFVLQEYNNIGTEMGKKAIEEKTIIDFFPTPQMKLAFNDRFAKDAQYLSTPVNENKFNDSFNYDFGYGEITPCYLVHLQQLLPAWRKNLIIKGSLLEEKFDLSLLKIETEKIFYKDITSSKLIFCDGIASFDNPFFKNLPFAPNKGEIIWIEAPDLPATHIFKKGMNIVPWSPGVFWVGSSYEWEFDHANPTEIFRERSTALLKHWLKVPFTLLDHKAAVRPATIERRPFIGFHPTHPALGIFNGMGTKGCSLAPFFAKQITEYIGGKNQIHPEADIKRFSRVLSR